MQTTNLKILGMTCPKCAARVEKALRTVPGVRAASVRLPDEATVQHDDVALDSLKQAVAASGGYRAELREPT